MKKLLILSMLALMLVGCNSIHKNISQDMADDTEQVIRIIEKNMKEDRDFTDREYATLEDYLLLYGAKENAPDFLDSAKMTEEEERLWILTRNLIEIYERSGLLSSDKESYKDTIKMIRNVIKTGKL